MTLRPVFQVEVEMPDTKKGWEQAVQNFEGYLVSALRRRAVEVREKTLSEEERAQFSGCEGNGS